MVSIAHDTTQTHDPRNRYLSTPLSFCNPSITDGNACHREPSAARPWNACRGTESRRTQPFALDDVVGIELDGRPLNLAADSVATQLTDNAPVEPSS